MNYARMIEILEAVKDLRQRKQNDSPYVCDNLAEVPGETDYEHPTIEVKVIRSDINQYIDGEWGVQYWMSKRDGVKYHRDDKKVHLERMKMIDHLIEKYNKKAKEIDHGTVH